MPKSKEYDKSHAPLPMVPPKSTEEIRRAQVMLANFMLDLGLPPEETGEQIREMLEALGLKRRTGLETH